MTARQWLRENGYQDVAAMIDEIMAELLADGSRQRRNWWDVLAGGRDGRPLVVSGRTFPVLKVAQKRQGMRRTKNAIARSRRESPPPPRPGRWLHSAWPEPGPR